LAQSASASRLRLHGEEAIALGGSLLDLGSSAYRLGRIRYFVGVAHLQLAQPDQAETLLVDVPVESAADQALLAGEIAAEHVAPFADLNGSVEYKRNLVRVFVSRCCTVAIERLNLE